jgi:putative methionine-R-sulfoxide reductase with GAF domain
VRHKVHSPAFVSMDGDPATTSVDLNPILDVSEEGISFYASKQMEAGHDFDLGLDVVETNRSIAATGRVSWSEPSGLTGIHFREMPNSSLRQLKEWLFLNAICACARYAAAQAREVELESLEEQLEPLPMLDAASPEELGVPSQQEYAEVLSAMTFVEREVEAARLGLERSLQLLSERSRMVTRAGGAAIAITDGEQMTCCASAGSEAPGIGARFQIGSGFSGECVRRGRMLQCDDAETDPLVDRQVCRSLGIRSILAMPVHLGDSVIGLLEVFSQQPGGFKAREKILLRRMANLMVAGVRRAAHPLIETVQPAPNPPLVVEPTLLGFEGTGFEESGNGDTPAEPAPETPGYSSFSRGQWIVVICAVGAILAAAALPLQRIIHPASGSRAPSPSPPALRRDVSKPLAGQAPPETDLQRLRRLAEQGDAAAQYSLGTRYALGEDVRQDYSVAAHWFSMAAEQGHIVAQATMGAYYDLGRGVPQDPAKAYFWAVLALAGGDEASKYRVSSLAATMSRSQIVAAQEQANAWLRQHQVSDKDN